MIGGTGPGAQTGDGCSVELYRLLPYLGELDAIRPFLTERASVLELGSGAGRLTRILLAWGLQPTAVDFSDEMLAHVPNGVEKICSSIQQLRLERSFDHVLLASCLINHPEEGVRRDYVHCATRHLRAGGRFILERHDPEWLENVREGGVSAAGPAHVFVEKVDRSGGRVAMRLRYEIEGQSWTHEFSASALREEEIERELAELGFAEVSWYGAKRRWAVALREVNDAT